MAELSVTWQDSSMGAQWFVLSFCLQRIPVKCTLLGILEVFMQIRTQFHFSALADAEGGFFPSSMENLRFSSNESLVSSPDSTS